MPSVEVRMPKWGDTMRTGVLVEWKVATGDHVAAGQSLAAIETDKVNAEIEAPSAGTVVQLLVDEGDEVAVGEPVATIQTA